MFRRQPSLVNSKAKDFPKGFTWLNTDRPLSLEQDLRGHVVLLDFWTYCCINCMHMLPDLEWIEKKYEGKPVMVIGVHSAKFYNEQETDNIREAIGRYEISHPVIVDQDMTIWQQYGITGWPTLVIIDPKGNIVYQQSGEGQRQYLDDIIGVLLERHSEKGTLAKEPLKVTRLLTPSAAAETRSRILSYPGKLSFSPGSSCNDDSNNDNSKTALLAISDSNHNRVLVVDADSGKIVHKIGSGEKGLQDGSFENCKFFRPQGLVWVDGVGGGGDNADSDNGSKIYVADTENHALREINLQSRTVRTLAGNGSQGHWIQSAQDGKVTQLSSPWDLTYYSVSSSYRSNDGGNIRNNNNSSFIFIAMAGLHQIWAYHIQTGRIGPFAGSGYEGIIDGSLEEAQFAQPSGLSIAGDYLFVADSEVSAVRRIDLRHKVVQTVVGAGLFVFGYKDGTLDQARLQHPLGVACNKEADKIYVADTYNHAIRLVDLTEKKVSTIVGKPEMKTICNIDDPACDTLGLFEPSDVKIRRTSTPGSGNLLYIADTNNHLIRIFDPDGKRVLRTLSIREE